MLFVHGFEIYADSQGLKRDRWAVLKRKALEVYSRLPVKEAHDYDYETLKNLLFKRFSLIEEGFKEKFRTAKPEVGEVPAQFVVPDLRVI